MRRYYENEDDFLTEENEDQKEQYMSGAGNRKKSTKKSSGKKAFAIGGALLLTGAFALGSLTGSLTHPFALAEEAQVTEAGTNAENETASGQQETTDIPTIYSGSFQQTRLDEEQQAVTTLPDLSGVVESTMASLVSITNIIEITQTGGNSFDEFYNIPFFSFGGYDNRGEEREPAVEETKAYGSGVIIGENGEELQILTNNHVAVYDKSGNSYFYSYSATTKELEVEFIDGSKHKADLKDADKTADLAVISVPLAELSDETKEAIRIASIGNSDEVKVGQGVIAIGNALGRGQTATFGYVSALNREVTTAEDGITRTLMQIDAPINGGNSGGGLFNSKGELIGINSSKNESIGVEGFGFAIPISDVDELIVTLKDSVPREALAEEDRGYLGMNGVDVDSRYVQAYGFPAGAMVVRITENGPAAEAGLQINDIITAVNGRSVISYEDLRSELAYYAPGDVVTLTLSRSTGNEFTEMNLDVTLVSRESLTQ